MPRAPRHPREPSAREIERKLTEPQRIILLILAEHKQMTWPQLRDAAAAKGIGEDELHLAMYGYPLPETGPGT